MRDIFSGICQSMWEFIESQRAEFPRHPVIGTIAELVIGTGFLYFMLFAAAYGG